MRACDVVGDLPRLFERTAVSSTPNSSPPRRPDRVRIAHRVAHQLRDLAQHAVAGLVAARVVHRLEAVEVEEAQHVRVHRRDARLRALSPRRRSNSRRLMRPVSASCVAWYDICRVRPAQLGDVVQQHHRADDLVGRVVATAQRRGGQLDRTLGAVPPRQQERTRPATERHCAALTDAELHRIAAAACDRSRRPA